jgi:murein L,D-transpeptidase YcbB/YkuD
MRGGLTRLMVCFWLLMAALSSYALEPGVDAEPQLTPAVAVLMGQRMTVRDEKALSGILGEFMKGQPLAYWSEDGRLGRLLTALDDLATDGLNPADYSIERLRQWQRSGAPNVEQEEVATRAYLLALLHLYRGKVDPAALDAHWNFASAQLELNALLVQARTAVDRSEPAAAFNFARPVRPEYNLLRTALARYRGLAYEGGWPAVPAGKPLKPGMTDPRVLVLRNRLQIAGLASREPQLNPALYDDELALDVIRFQREAYLTPDGAIGPSTLAALNLPVARRIDQLRANLERMRWVHDPGTGPMVVVDIAGFRISLCQRGAGDLEIKGAGRALVSLHACFQGHDHASHPEPDLDDAPDHSGKGCAAHDSQKSGLSEAEPLAGIHGRWSCHCCQCSRLAAARQCYHSPGCRRG